MADDRHTFELIARQVIRATEPLIEAGTSFGAFKRLMARLGFDATSLPAPYAALGTQVQAAVTTLESFPASPSLADLLGLLTTGKGVFDAIQGLAGAFVERIDGSHSNVVGLPLVETLELLRRAGVAMPWSAQR